MKKLETILLALVTAMQHLFVSALRLYRIRETAVQRAWRQAGVYVPRDFRLMPVAGGAIIEGAVQPFAAYLNRYGREIEVSTIAELRTAIDNAQQGDKIFLRPGQYDPGATALVVDVANVTLIGQGGRGAAYIEPDTAGMEGLQVTADDVTLINLGVAGESASSYAINLNAVSRFRAIGCKFEGPDGTVVLLDGTADDQCADVLFEECEFAWGGSGALFDDSAYGYPTQIFFNRCRFHNVTAVGIGLAPAGGVTNLHVVDCVFDNQEDGTAPTDYIKVDRAGDTGIITGCRFATATNDTGVLTIAAGIMWAANATEAGWSTARPA